MKRNVMGIIALIAIIGFSFTACEEQGTENNPADIAGSWYSAQWQETFTFDSTAKTFEKVKDEGWGEKGTYTITTSTFTTTILEIKNELSEFAWIPFNPATVSNGGVETRAYNINNNVLLLNGTHIYLKQ